MKTRRKPSSIVNLILVLAAIVAVVSIGSSVGNISIGKGFFDSSQAEKISAVKSRQGNCKFTMTAEWAPSLRTPSSGGNISLVFSFNGETGSPNVSRSPWSIVKSGPCSSRASVQITQVVYRMNEASCKITVDRVIFSSVKGSNAKVVRCST